MKSEKRNYSEMYEYVSKGNTLYDTLTETLGMKDLSTETIINSLRTFIDVNQDKEELTNTAKFRVLVNTYNKDIHGRIVDSMRDNLTERENRELVEKLQSVNPQKYNFPNLLAYINFLEDANFTKKALLVSQDGETVPVLDPDIEDLNRILISTAINKADPEVVSQIRRTLIHVMLIPSAKQIIYKNNPELIRKPERKMLDPQNKDVERLNKATEDLKKLNLLGKIYFDKKTISDYDNVVAYVEQTENTEAEKARLKVDCELKRLATISSFTGKPMQELLETQNSSNTVASLISKGDSSPKKEYIPREGDYYWSFVQCEEPNVILSEPVEYSEDGVENQILVLVSHGDFLYGKSMGSSRYDEMPMELVGATILGKDGNSNYFFLTSHKNIGNIVNGKDKEYYKKVLCSQFVLNDTVMTKGGYLPEISIDENGHASLEYDPEFTMLDSNPLDALKYANTFPGSIGRGKEAVTLQEIRNSQKLFTKHMSKVYEAVRQMEEKKSKIERTVEEH